MIRDRESVTMSETARLRREMYAETSRLRREMYADIRRLRSDMDDRVSYVDSRLTRHIYDGTHRAFPIYGASSYVSDQESSDSRRKPFRLMDFLIKVCIAEVVLIWVLIFVLYWTILTR